MIARASILLATCVALALGCGCAQAPPKGAGEQAPPKGPGEQAPPKGSGGKPFSAEEQKVVNFAQAFLKKEGVDWGGASEVRPTQVEYRPGWKGEGYFIVSYPTPADEINLLGDRSVVVELKTGNAAFVPRD